MIKKITIAIAVAILIFAYIAISSYRETKRLLVFELYQITRKQIEERQEGYVSVIMKYIDDGINCADYPTKSDREQCQRILSKKIFQAIGNTEQIRNNYPDLKCGHPESTLFVKETDGKLQVLELSGNIHELSTDGLGTKKVSTYIKYPYMQIIDRVFDLSQSTVYLGVFYSESEVIVPIHYNGKNIGAVIKHCAT